MPKIIGIDCDEVLSNTMDQLLQTRYAQERHLQREDITSYNLWEIPKFDLSREEAKDFFF
jgi:5'(3')-deoxyribonucleotidase